MPSPAPIDERPRLAVRCDGDAGIGAGHVARCLPLADAFARRGWSVVFVGRFDGLAAWLIERAGRDTTLPVDGARLRPGAGRLDRGDRRLLRARRRRAVRARRGSSRSRRWARRRRCDEAGDLIDYHLDRDRRAAARGTTAPGAGLRAARSRVRRRRPRRREGRDGARDRRRLGAGPDPPRVAPASSATGLPRRRAARPARQRGDGPPARLVDLVEHVDLGHHGSGPDRVRAGVRGRAPGGGRDRRQSTARGRRLRRSGLADCIDVYAGERLEAARRRSNGCATAIDVARSESLAGESSTGTEPIARRGARRALDDRRVPRRYHPLSVSRRAPVRLSAALTRTPRSPPPGPRARSFRRPRRPRRSRAGDPRPRPR